MPERLNFYDTLFHHQKIILTQPGQTTPPLNRQDAKVGIFSHSDIAHGGEHEQLLQSMMAACKLLPEDWVVFPKGVNYQALSNLSELRYLLLLGSSEQTLNISARLPWYQPFRLHGKVWIKAHDLATLGKDSKYKKMLWTQALKPVFL